jgi:hypothetical protein
MVTRTQLIDRMAVGYQPTCKGQPGLWPCFPITPRFGLMGLGQTTHHPTFPRYGAAGLGMLTGRVTHGMGQLVSVDTSWFNDPNQAMIMGIPNWLTVGVGGFALLSMILTTTRGVKATARGVGKQRRKAAAAAAAYQATQ